MALNAKAVGFDADDDLRQGFPFQAETKPAENSRHTGTKQAYALCIGNRPTGVAVVADDRWPGMWRVHHAGGVTDMVNLTRAKDAAISFARDRGFQNNTLRYHWRVIVRGLEAPPMRQNGGP